jgi:hypothetical protein
MADGMRAFGIWLSTPADDGAAHVAELGMRLTDVLGPPTAEDPERSDAERRADLEREIGFALDAMLCNTPAQA